MIYAFALHTSFSQTKPDEILLPVKMNGLWGLIDTTGKMIIPPKYNFISYVQFGKFVIIEKNKKKGISDIFGNVIVEPTFDEILIPDTFSYFAGNYETNKDGELENTSESINDSLLDEREMLYNIYPFHENLTLFKKYPIIRKKTEALYTPESNGLIGLISNKREILPPVYTTINIKGGFLFVLRDQKWGCADMNGNLLLENKYDNIYNLEKFLVVIKKNNAALFSSVKKDFITDFIYDGFYSNYFMNNFIIYSMIDSKIGAIDSSGKTIFNVDYNSISPVLDANSRISYYIINKDSLFGITNKEGRQIIPLEYDFIAGYEDNLFKICKNDLCGVINSSGKSIYPVSASKIQFFDGNIKVYDNSSIILIETNRNGVETNRFRYENVGIINVASKVMDRIPIFTTQAAAVNSTVDSSGWFLDKDKELWGLKDDKDSIRIKPIYKRIYNIPHSPYTITNLQVKTYSNANKNKVERIDEKFGIVNKYIYRQIIVSKYDNILLGDYLNFTHNNSFIGIKSGKYHFITEDYPLKTFSYIGEFSEGYAAVNNTGKIILNKKNPSSVCPVYEHNRRFQKSVLNRISTYLEFEYRFSNWIELKGGQWGLIDSYGSMIIPFEYRFLSGVKKQNIIAKNNYNKWGVINVRRSTVVPFEYDFIDYAKNSNDSLFLLLKNNNKFGVMDSLGQLLTMCIYDEIFPFSNEFAKVSVNKLYGYIDNSGKIVIEPEYSQARNFKEELAAVKIKTKWGFIDKKGNVVINPEFSSCGDFSEGLAWAKLKKKYGYIDVNGNFSIPAEYNFVWNFCDGRAVVQMSNKFGVIDKQNQFIIKPRKKTFTIDKNEKIIVCSGRRSTTFYDLDGQKKGKVLGISQGFSEGLCMIKRKGKYGYCDSKGDILIKPAYKIVKKFSNGIAAVSNRSKWGYIDKNGEVIVPLEYKSVILFGASLIAAESRDSTVIFNLKGDVIASYKDYRPYNQNKYFVSLYNSKGNTLFLNSDCKELALNGITHIIPVDTNIFLKWSKNGDNLKILDKNGNQQSAINMINPIDNNIKTKTAAFPKSISNGLYSYSTSHYYCLADCKGKMIIKNFFENIEYAGGNIFRVETCNKIGYITRSGSWIWEPQR